MSKAKITAPLGFKCCPQGHTVQTFPQGMVVEGKVAEWALAAKAASRMFDPRTEAKVESPSETKAKRKPGRPRKDAK